MFKADFHLHSRDDYEHPGLHYSTLQLIDKMALMGYSVLALTFHNQMYYTKDLVTYAKKKGILLIPGVELRVEKKHILVYNAKPAELAQVKTFSDLAQLRRDDTLIVAAHPFFGRIGAGKKLHEHPEAFDGVEYCHFYLSWLNKNKKAIAAAKKHNFLVLGNSDAHAFKQLGHTYTLVPTNKDVVAVLKAIKERKHQLVTKPLSFKTFFRIGLWAIRPRFLGTDRYVATFKDRTDGSLTH